MQQGRISAREDSAEPSSICFQTKMDAAVVARLQVQDLIDEDLQE